MKKNLSKVLIAALVIPTFLGASQLSNAEGQDITTEIVENSSTKDHKDSLKAQNEYDKAYEDYYKDQDTKEDAKEENSSTKEYEDSLKAQDEYNKAYEDYYKDKEEDKKDDKKEDGKTTIPAKKIEDIAKPNKKEETENNEIGFNSKAAAEKAAKEALKNDPINKNFSVSENNGKFFYVLTAAEDLSDVKAPEEEKTKTKPYAKLDEKANEKSFDFDKGFKTKEEAIKQAEALVKNSEINKGYNVSMGADGRYYIELTPEETKTEGTERKPIEKGTLKKVEEKKEDKKEEKKAPIKEIASQDGKGTNVNTGVAGISGIIATLSAATIGLFKSKRK